MKKSLEKLISLLLLHYCYDDISFSRNIMVNKCVVGCRSNHH